MAPTMLYIGTLIFLWYRTPVTPVHSEPPEAFPAVEVT
jgi:hypothetical protein